MSKKSKEARRASNSHYSSPAVPLGSPILAAIERPVTTQQLAAHLQVTTRTLATYRAERLIPYWRVNSRCLRYRISDVERALERNNA